MRHQFSDAPAARMAILDIEECSVRAAGIQLSEQMSHLWQICLGKPIAVGFIKCPLSRNWTFGDAQLLPLAAGLSQTKQFALE
jgi:hypothetical protein